MIFYYLHNFHHKQKSLLYFSNIDWLVLKVTIVFSNSRGLFGVEVDRSTWNNIRDLKEGETYLHTVDPSKNELYGGQEVTYYAPFDKCDRVEDYKVAWAFFERAFE